MGTHDHDVSTRSFFERKARLRRAAALIESVVTQLNTEGHTCEECGTLRRDDWLEFQSATVLRNMPTKLREVADKI
jgi:hypothetical protein